MSKFAKVKKGLAANIAARLEASKAEKARWQAILSQVPPSTKKLAIKLLSDDKIIPAEQIVQTCQAVADASGQAETQSSKQDQFAKGMTTARELLGLPLSDIPQAFFSEKPGPGVIDPAAFAAGRTAGKALKQFLAAR